MSKKSGVAASAGYVRPVAAPAPVSHRHPPSPSSRHSPTAATATATAPVGHRHSPTAPAPAGLSPGNLAARPHVPFRVRTPGTTPPHWAYVYVPPPFHPFPVYPQPLGSNYNGGRFRMTRAEKNAAAANRATKKAATGAHGHRGGVRTAKRRNLLNILGTKLQPCSLPSGKRTGFFRTGTCVTSPEDRGTHVICAIMTDAFLQFTRSRGNDLITPGPGFPGLQQGDRWCVCALRWKEAYDANPAYAPPLVAEATSRLATRFIPLNILLQHAISQKK